MQKDPEHVGLEELGDVQEREVEIARRKPGEERAELERNEREVEALRGELLLEEAREHAARAVGRDEESQRNPSDQGRSGAREGGSRCLSRAGSVGPVPFAEEAFGDRRVVFEEVVHERWSIDRRSERTTDRDLREGARVDARKEVGDAAAAGLACVHAACLERRKEPRGNATERHVGVAAREAQHARVLVAHRLDDHRVRGLREHPVRARAKDEAVAAACLEPKGTEARELAPGARSVVRLRSREDGDLEVREQRGVRVRELEADPVRSFDDDRAQWLCEATVPRGDLGRRERVPGRGDVFGGEGLSRGEEQVFAKVDFERGRAEPAPGPRGEGHGLEGLRVHARESRVHEAARAHRDDVEAVPRVEGLDRRGHEHLEGARRVLGRRAARAAGAREREAEEQGTPCARARKLERCGLAMRFAPRVFALALLAVSATGVEAKPRKHAAPKPVLHAAKEAHEATMPASASAAGPLLAKLLGAKVFEGKRLGVAVWDLEAGSLVHAHAHEVALNPASNAKLLTAAAALGTLGGAHTFVTTVSGGLEGGVVDGPLVLRGHGDPSFSTADVADLVERVLQRGVRSVKGGILVDQSFFDDAFVPPAFEQQEDEWSYFRANTSAISLDGNTMTFVVDAGEKGEAARVRVEPEGAAIVEGEIRCDSTKGDKPELALRVEGGVVHAKVAGSIRPGAHGLRYVKRAHDPRLLAGSVLRRLLVRAGVTVTGEVALGSAPEKRVLAEHTSAPLASLLLRVGKQSDNFYAEMIFRTLDAEAKGKRGGGAGAANAVTSFLERIGVNDAGLVVKNGSGLFDANRVSPALYVKLLSWAWREPSVHPEFLAQLAVGGVDGTLRARFDEPELRGRIRAKTGTLEHVASLAGYILRRDGRAPIAFALIANDVNDVPSARVAFDAFVRGLVVEADAAKGAAAATVN